VIPRRVMLLIGALGMLPACSAWGRAVLAPLPASHLAREVVIFHQKAEAARLSTTGRHEVVVPCANAPGHTETLRVEITIRAPSPPADYRPADAAELRRLCARDARAKVQFIAVLRQEVPVALPPVLLPDGRLAAASRGFVTAEGTLCLVPAQTPGAEEAAVPGLKVRAWGVTVAAQGGAVVMLEGIRPEPSDANDELPWRVSVNWSGREVASLDEPGDYPLRLPCTHVAGAVELIGVQVRQFRLSDIEVDGHPVRAELAATPESRSYGLQGRAGLPADYGMLFWFPRPERPVFMMKTVSFPLSIAFIREDGTITNIVRLNPADRRVARPREPVRYVLEMEQGWFEARGIGPGKKVSIP